MTETVQPEPMQLHDVHALQGLTEVSKGSVFERLNKNIPINDYHLPTHIYRADLIPEDIFTYPPHERAPILDSASLEITFNHGYPAINEVTPLWEKLPAESEDAFDAFVLYLELPESSGTEHPIRFLPLIANLTKRTVQQLAEWSSMFYWQWRSRAYDLFLLAAHKKQREQRIMSLEGKHFKMAADTLSKVELLATRYLDSAISNLANAEDILDSPIKLKDLVDSMIKLVAIQRVSVGLPSAGPAQVDVKFTGPRNADVNETMKYVAKEGNHEAPATRRSDDIDALLQNPDDLNAIQEMMIRLTAPHHQLPAWGKGTTIDVLANRDLDEDGDPIFNENDSGYKMDGGLRDVDDGEGRGDA